jgi:hypothetical protein
MNPNDRPRRVGAARIAFARTPLALMLGPLALMALSACASTPGSPGEAHDAVAVRLDDEETATVSIAAPREEVYEAAIREIRRRGAVLVSSLEGGWITAEMGEAAVRVELSNPVEGQTLVRIPRFSAHAVRRSYSRVAEELPQYELARRVAEQFRGT